MNYRNRTSPNRVGWRSLSAGLIAGIAGVSSSVGLPWVQTVSHAYSKVYGTSRNHYDQIHSLEHNSSQLSLGWLAQQGIRHEEQENREQQATLEALRVLRETLAITRATGDVAGQVNMLRGIGDLSTEIRDYQAAIAAYQELLALQQSIAQPQVVLNTLSRLAFVYNQLGLYAQVLEVWNQSLGLSRQLGDPTQEAAVLNNLGQLYSNVGQYERALALYEESLKVLQSLGDPAVILPQQWNNIARMHQELGNYDMALRFYNQALTIAVHRGDQAGEGTILSNIGGVYAVQMQNQKALELYQAALAIYQEQDLREEEGVALNNIGSVYHDLKQYKQALNYYQQALQRFQQEQARPSIATARQNIGAVLLRLGQYDLAEENLNQALAIMEALRPGLDDRAQVSLADTQRNSYHLLQEVLVAQGRPEKALEVAERGRARAFVELLAKRLVNQHRQIGAGSRLNGGGQGKTSTSSMVTQAITIEEIKQVAREQNATLVQYTVLFDENDRKPDPSLPNLFVWVVTPQGQVTVRSVNLHQELPGVTSLTELVNAGRSEVVGGSRGVSVAGVEEPKLATSPTEPPTGLVFQENPQWLNQAREQIQSAVKETALQQLYQVLVEPIADLLPADTKGRVIMIPQSQLFLVPFPALQDAQGHYLIERYTLSTAPA
ncbi:MAG: CHAT domain-containing tetratricopeptide repeat protein, partial [Cyanobacteria bacterium]|nr:CHAT domain-containing tetratricopeptide repeat protein [Cyanobacteriota bacterium]MDW8201958.1 tetratricopeptide repeat protein [Cyanobacteriota bacterium SKYGB_h_bin112]